MGYTHKITYLKDVRGIHVECSFRTVEDCLEIHLRGLAANKEVIKIISVIAL